MSSRQRLFHFVCEPVDRVVKVRIFKWVLFVFKYKCIFGQTFTKITEINITDF